MLVDVWLYKHEAESLVPSSDAYRTNVKNVNNQIYANANRFVDMALLP